MSAFDANATLAALATTPDARELLDDLSVGNLQALCTKAGIAYRSRDRKPALVAALINWSAAQTGEDGTEEPAAAPAVTADRDEDNNCTECGEHTSDPHAPGCPNELTSEDLAATDTPATTEEPAEADELEEMYAEELTADEPGQEESTEEAPAEEPAVAPAGFTGPQVGEYLLIAPGVATTKSILFLVDSTAATEDGAVEVKGRQFLIKHRTISPLAKVVKVTSADDYEVVLPAGTALDDAAKEVLVVAARPERFGPGGKEARKGKRPVLTVNSEALDGVTPEELDALSAKVAELLPGLLEQVRA